MPAGDIVIRGAREHNLQNVDLTLPRNKLIVMTGVSGSGKSSLAFDTLYAEGQRRYVESLSSYARQFLGQMPKPDVDAITGLAPSISIQQKAAGKNPRSTVGTITEIYDYLRVLYARIAKPTCYQCGRPITAQTRDQIVESVLQIPDATRFMVLAPLVQRQKGEFKDLFADLLKQGFLRARVDGKIVQLDDDLQLDKQMKHTIEVVVDRLVAGKTPRARVAEAVEQALNLADGRLIISRDGATNSPAIGGADSEVETSATLNPQSSTLDQLFSSDYACTHCGISYEPPSPQLFSFNSPLGMCVDCNGLGVRHDFVLDRLIPDPSLSIAKGALELLGKLSKVGRWRRHVYEGIARAIETDLKLPVGAFLKTPWQELPEAARQLFLYGLGERNITFAYRHHGGVWKHGGTYAGYLAEMLADYRRTNNPMRRKQLEKYMEVVGCQTCHGSRLNRQACSYRLTGKVESRESRVESLPNTKGGKRKAEGARQDESSHPQSAIRNPLSLSLPEVCSLSTVEAAEFFEQLELDDTQRYIAEEVLKEIRGRLGFLLRCGLDYLTLDRTAPTLSGGESQRIRLAGQIGCGLVGVVYILDEPSIGLHPRDNTMLLGSLQDLRDQGNTVIVVEHDEETMRAADHVVDFGPGPGVRGGRVVAAGTIDDIQNCDESLTGAYLSGRRTIEIAKQRLADLPNGGRERPESILPQKRRRNQESHAPRSEAAITIVGATHHNLKDVTVELPLGKFICITGVSGSGKSSLINDILWEVLNRDVNKGVGQPGAHQKVLGLEHIDKAIDIDQTPIGRTPRSNPATYVKLFDLIRDLYTQLPESKLRGFKPGRFSFNVEGGRCEACEGHGATKLEMDFLADIWVTCPVCQGRRFNKETLDVHFKGKSIADVLDMDVQQALEHFENFPKIKQLIQALHDVGLDYMKLGQPSPTLSGGEAQRVKLARELGKRSTGKTVYILDEPTTGLHFLDVEHLLTVLHGFVDAGNTVIVVEHSLDVIKTADWVIDLGPEGGSGGGRIVATGTPEEIAKCAESHTGAALKRYLLPSAGRQPIDSASKKVRGRNQGANAPRSESARWQTATKLAAHNGADENIVIRGAAQHNLQHLNLQIPRDQMSVFCGPSGSGKSSLAMDTLYAEGQRRYVESLSSYARQFLGQMPKPKVEHIHGLQPAIAIEQKTVGHTPRSTVGTVTEIFDYLRILYARLGTQHCPNCQIPVQAQTVDDVLDKLQALPAQTRLLILAPQEVAVGQQYAKLWERLKEQGFRRVRIDGATYKLEEVPEIDRRRKHNVEIVVDRVTIQPHGRSRLADSVELAFDYGQGTIRTAVVDDDRPESKWKVQPFSLFRACEKCGRSFEELAPQNFSFNSPLGWCESCEGLGVQQGTNLAALISDPNRTLLDGAVAAWPDPQTRPIFRQMLEAVSLECDLPLDVPYSQLEPSQQRTVLYGTGDRWFAVLSPSGGRQPPESGSTKKGRRNQGADAPRSESTLFRFQYKGLYPAIEEASRVSYVYRQRLYDLVGEVPCQTCGGSRLREDAAAVRLNGKTLKQLCDLPLNAALGFLNKLSFDARQKKIAGDLLSEATNRLSFLVDVGLHYLTLDRALPTLSGGESQRIRLAGQIGRALTGVLYVLDEPTIGLHPSDNGRLLHALKKLRDLGNTIVMVEHDREVISNADRLYDFGPGAGRFGGRVTAEGSPAELVKAESGRRTGEGVSLTAKYLSGREQIVIPRERRVAGGSPGTAVPGLLFLELRGARLNNLRNVDVKIPLKTLTAVTGVSGSGKSSLIQETLAKAVSRKLNRSSDQPGPYDEIFGVEHLNKLIVVDQQPLGNTPASNPATYTGVFEEIRELFARLPEAKVRGYRAARFSFNRPGGRCEACEGNGQKKIEMHFLPDVWVACEVCHGKRYNTETLAVTYKDKSIADVLDMSIGDAAVLFENIPKIRAPLAILCAIGLDYLSLGQPAPTLSGGEAQRVKLAAELARPQSGRTLYLLDEPTTGLHFDDIRKLLKILNSLVDAGNTVVVIEHNLDVIKTADWIIDLGPHAGSEGGWIVAEGTPEDLVNGFLSGGREPPESTSNKNGRRNQGTDVPRSEEQERKPSLTARALVDVLAAGTRGERESFDPLSVMKKQSGDVDLNDVGKHAQMPWEKNGKKWHTKDRVAHNGKPCRWDGRMLSEIIEELTADGEFAPVNWNDRSVVEVIGPNKSAGWFLHARTADEWLLTLHFRVGKNTFNQDELATDLDLKSIDDLDDIPVYGRADRVRVKNAKPPWQDVIISLCKPEDIETDAFHLFLQEAKRSYLDQTKPEKLDLDELMPWKVLGRKWHLMRKGFLKGRVVWEPEVIEKLTALLDELWPDAKVDWGQKVLVHYNHGAKRTATLVTKRPEWLEMELTAPTGSVALGRIADLGVEPSIAPHRSGEDAIRLRFTTAAQVVSPKLREFLKSMTPAEKTLFK